jgi:hypothetical protein
MFKKIDIFWSIYLAHRCFKFDVSTDDIIDVSKILRIPSGREGPILSVPALKLQNRQHNLLFGECCLKKSF